MSALPKKLSDRLRGLDTTQLVILAAMVVVAVVVVVLVGPSFLPKPASTPQQLTTVGGTPSKTAAPASNVVPKDVREAVLAAVQNDGITVNDPNSVRVMWGKDKSHVIVYGQFGGQFKQYRYAGQNGEWHQQ